MSVNCVSPDSLDTFVGTAARYMTAAARTAYKSVIFTDRLGPGPWRQSPLSHLPSDIRRLEFSCNRALPRASRLAFFSDLRTFRIWAEDDTSLESALMDLPNMTALEEFEIGWTGGGHRLDGILSGADSALVTALGRLPSLRRLTLFGGYASPCLRADCFNDGGFSKLPLEELTICGMTVHAGRRGLRLPSTLRVLRIHGAYLPWLDTSACNRLEVLSIHLGKVDGLGSLERKHRLQRVILDGEILDPELGYLISDRVFARYRLHLRLPPHMWKAPRPRPRSA